MNNYSLLTVEVDQLGYLMDQFPDDPALYTRPGSSSSLKVKTEQTSVRTRSESSP